MFNLFGRKKEKSIFDEIKEIKIYQEALKLLEQSKNLSKLGRNHEAQDIYLKSEKIAFDYYSRNKNSTHANLLLANIYLESTDQERAVSIIKNLLNPSKFALSEDKRLELEHYLQRIDREKPHAKRSFENKNNTENYTSIYSCQNCGRIINFVTVPCPYCYWYAQDLSSLARSIVLSTLTMNVPTLLLLARNVAQGRQPSDVVISLDDRARQAYETPEDEANLRKMLNLLHKNAELNFRDINSLRECPSCSNRIFLCTDETCDSCGEIIRLPDSLKLLLSMDNLLWLFENRLEIVATTQFSEFICLLTVMINDLLRKQETPSLKRREYSMSLLMEMKVIFVQDKGAFIITNNLDDIKLHYIDEKFNKVTEANGYYLYSELNYFVDKMLKGVSN